MNSVIWLLMVAYIGGTLAGILPVNPGGIGGLFRGPNSETIIRGPDGSEITSEQIGGNIQTEARLETIIVPDDYPDDQIAVSSVTVSPVETISISNNIVPGSTAHIAGTPETSGVHLQLSSIPAASIPQTIPVEAPAQISASIALPTHEEPHIIETELVDAPEIEPNQSSDLKGPSGSISVRGSSAIISGPASTTITEPVRRIPLATIPIAAPAPAVPSAVLIPPNPTVNVEAVGSIQSNVASDVQETLSLNANLLPPEVPNAQIQFTAPSYSLQPPRYSTLNAELVPPPPPNAGTLDRISQVNIGDASLHYPQTQSVSSTPIPPESLPPNAIDLGQTIVSTTQRTNVAPSSADIDVGRINLGQSNTQQSIGLPVGQSVSSTVSPIDELNIISSTPTTILPSSSQTSLTLQQNSDISVSTERPLFIPASDIRSPSNINSIQPYPTSSLNGPDLIITPNGADGRTYSQDQSIITNQIITNTARPEVNLISSTAAPTIEVTNGISSRPWLQIEPDHILPRAPLTVSGGHSGPISTILDTVLVQPTDPKNREVIEFNGKQLENVGNIVPVLHQPTLIAGGLTHIHNIPTASVSQLVSRNDFNNVDFSRYQRQTSRN